VHSQGRSQGRAPQRGHQLNRLGQAIGILLGAAAVFLACAAPACALITPPVTVDGPSSQILDFGGVSMAEDGNGGLVYLKAVEGVPHVFACRYLEGHWTAPIQVDWDQPYPASQPRIVAGPQGRLLVVWVTQVATVHGSVQHGLFSARIGSNGSSFGPSLVVDPNVGDGLGVDPALSAAAPGKAIVAYRAITYTFKPGTFSTAVQLRPGDVMADIRLARLSGDRWSRIGAVNRNPEASMRPPAPTNGPQVGSGLDGGAVVAWQEPDQTGTARIWMRRIFGSTPGPVLPASPVDWQGAPVTADADAFSLSVTPYAGARVAFRIVAGGGSALGGRLLTNALPPLFANGASALSGPELADGGNLPVGPPDVAVAETENKQMAMRLGFLSGSQLRQMQLANGGVPAPLQTPPGPTGVLDSRPVVAVDPEGGGLVAYPALDALGLQVVAVRQEFRSGEAQTATVSGAGGGPIGELSIGRSGAGDGLIAFRQGEAGRYAIVAERTGTPPAAFRVEPPKGWSRPNGVRLRWGAARSGVGGVLYTLFLDGHPVRRNLRRLSFHPSPAMLGDGVIAVQVQAADRFGQWLLSNRAKLRVDGNPPLVQARVRKAHKVVVRLGDSGSGLARGATVVSFGDGERDRGGSKFVHSYPAPGRRTIVVRARDKVGNRLWRRLKVAVR
jgi:hypothetical protein